jgi:hypothetical protein
LEINSIGPAGISPPRLGRTGRASGLPVAGRLSAGGPGSGGARRRRPRSGASTDRKGGRSGLAGPGVALRSEAPEDSPIGE